MVEKRVQAYKNALQVLFFTLLLLSIFCVKNIRAEEDGNLIYVAYDDSGSMLRSTNSNTGESMMADRWCQAKYALEVWGCGRFLGPELSNSKTASILHRTQTP